MRFHRLDLNLLVVLDALLTEQSVSVAADRLCLSQSATSSALRRLRDYFEDDLLIQNGRAMMLTTRAEELIEPVRDVLHHIGQKIAVAPHFDPSTTERVFRIMTTDYVSETLLAPAMQRFAKSAPQISFEVAPLSGSLIDVLERGSADILMSIDLGMSDDHPKKPIFEDDFVIVACKDNKKVENGIDKALFFELGHVVARFGLARVPSFDHWFVKNQNSQRRQEVATTGFASMPSFLVGTERIATMQRRLAYSVCERYSLQQFELPFEVPPIVIHAQWHTYNESDKGTAWLISEFRKVADELSETHGFRKEFEAYAGNVKVETYLDNVESMLGK